MNIEKEIALAREAANDPAAVSQELYDALVQLIEQTSPLVGIRRYEGDKRFDRLLGPLGRARRACWAAETVAASRERSGG